MEGIDPQPEFDYYRRYQHELGELRNTADRFVDNYDMAVDMLGAYHFSAENVSYDTRRPPDSHPAQPAYLAELPLPDFATGTDEQKRRIPENDYVVTDAVVALTSLREYFQHRLSGNGRWSPATFNLATAPATALWQQVICHQDPASYTVTRVRLSTHTPAGSNKSNPSLYSDASHYEISFIYNDRPVTKVRLLSFGGIVLRAEQSIRQIGNQFRTIDGLQTFPDIGSLNSLEGQLDYLLHH